jgi:hypothetical protein
VTGVVDAGAGLLSLQWVDPGHGAVLAVCLTQFLISLYPFVHLVYGRKNESEVEEKHIKAAIPLNISKETPINSIQ